MDLSLDELKQASPLGKNCDYEDQYNPSLLFALDRQPKRSEIGIHDGLPFKGIDVWHAYELSWLNLQGKPQVAIATITVPCDSPKIFESKSLKLYLNSLNGTPIATLQALETLMARDLCLITGSTVSVLLEHPRQFNVSLAGGFQAQSIDDLDIETPVYGYTPDFLKTGGEIIEESLSSDLLKSNCLITHQPDWGSVFIQYRGKAIDHEGLLRYIVSLRNHHEFHEQCVERIFMDLLQRCQPESLTVYAAYTRRGGIDINPYRSTLQNWQTQARGLTQQRLSRQ